MMLLQQHEQIAMMGMGKIKNPVTDRVERDLNSAKYAIDTLVMLENFTKGNLSKELEGYLRQLLTNLRLNYADEKKKDPAKEKEKETSGSEKGATGAQKEDKKESAGEEEAEKKAASGAQKTEKKESAGDKNGEKKQASGDQKKAGKKESSAKDRDESDDKDS